MGGLFSLRSRLGLFRTRQDNVASWRGEGPRDMLGRMMGVAETQTVTALSPRSFSELEVREHQIVVTGLRRTKGRIYGTDGAAALLQVRPTTLVSKMKRLNVQKERD